MFRKIRFFTSGIVGGCLLLLNAASAGPTPNGIASDNVEHVKHVPLAQNGVGGRLIGKYFYMNDQNKIMIFDVSDPEDPEMTGSLLMPQEWQFSREDLDGNGKILVIPNTVSGVNDGTPPEGSATNAVYIVDVEDKTNPRIISKINGPAQHTYSCVLDCNWAYGSEGTIIDLRDPADPKLIEAQWSDDKPASGGHDVEEVRPGLVMTATQPLMLLDSRKDPTRPQVIALGRNDDSRFIHGTRWPRSARDRLLLAAGETTFNGRCNDSSGAFMTWDTRNWKRTHTFRMIDEYRVVNGIYADGNPPAQRNCTSHWFEEHPDFRNGGYVAAAFYDHGTRFFDVSGKGKISEAGYFMTYAGQASAAYWITDEIVYVVDYNRGLDILRFSPPTT
ncbi:MAG: LVIVD repeat-containing protein [Actinomycetota bacterium]